MPVDLRVAPITLRDARRVVGELHRHARPPIGGLFAVQVIDPADICHGVGVASRPVARGFDDGATLEVTRVATDGTPNACSMIYGALVRAGKALGYQRFVTYTLEHEPGTALRASGWRFDGLTRDASWATATDPKRGQHNLWGQPPAPPGRKRRWMKP